MLQHDGDLKRLASIYGDLTRPTQFKLRLAEALSDTAPSITTKPVRFLRKHN